MGMLLCRLWKAKDRRRDTKFDVHLASLNEDTVAVNVGSDHYFIGLNAYQSHIENQWRWIIRRKCFC